MTRGFKELDDRSEVGPVMGGPAGAVVPSYTCMPQWIHHGWPDTIPYNIHKEVRYGPTQ
jgi:hypothetical protein